MRCPHGSVQLVRAPCWSFGRVFLDRGWCEPLRPNLRCAVAQRGRMEGMSAAEGSSAQDVVGYGTVEQLLGLAEANFHVDLTDTETALILAANSVTRGAWRNNSELEAIHCGMYKRPGQPAPRGLTDAEMMVGNIQTARLFRTDLASRDWDWYLRAEAVLLDFDRPYAGTPLTDHVTKKVLAKHRSQVKSNLDLFAAIRRAIDDWDLFLTGLALADLAYGIRYGSPLWPAQVDAWAEAASPTPDADVVEALKTDPTQLPLDELAHVIRTGLTYARGHERWHRGHCGNEHHQHDPALTRFLGIHGSLMGIPVKWLAERFG